MIRALPLLRYAEHRLLSWKRGSAISAADFLGDVHDLAGRLPEHGHVINLFQSRYHFMVGFAATMVRKQVTLLPPNQTSGVIRELAEEFPDSYYLCESERDDLVLPSLFWQSTEQKARAEVPIIDAEQLIAIAFTSGTTGKPKPHKKYWGDLNSGAEQAIEHLGFVSRRKGTIVATVPSQHMYGFEFAMLVPWLGEIGVHGGRPFFPMDIRDALRAVPGPRVLLTTPLHLRTCLAAGLDWPEIDCVISATAPLSTELAREAESVMQTRVMEVYGTTETGSIASRLTAQEVNWRLYDHVTLLENPGGFFVSGGHIRDSVRLDDHFELVDCRHFKLVGRDTDMIKIAGKRASLTELNQRLNEIEGVRDGVFLLPDDENGEKRLTALVVAPGHTKRSLLDQLSLCVDPAFLPRPVIFVESLPRNETGKLPRRLLLDLINSLNEESVEGAGSQD